jgi:putative transposase
MVVGGPRAMPVKRKQHSAKFKFRVALESMKGQKTVSQIAQEYGVHPSRIHAWKKQLREEGDSLFERKSQSQKQENHEQEVSELYEQIGRLKMELEWLKKKTALFD